MRFMLVFPPLWSIEGPHFALAHLQGFLMANEHCVRVVDLNLRLAHFYKRDWEALSGNDDGLWSKPDTLEELLYGNGIAEHLAEHIRDFRPDWVVFVSVSAASIHAVGVLTKFLKVHVSGVPRFLVAAGGPACFSYPQSRHALSSVDFVGPAAFESAFQSGFSSEVGHHYVHHSRSAAVWTGIDLNGYSLPDRLPYVLNFGCRYHCRFCHEGAQYRSGIIRPAGGLGTELKLAMQHLAETTSVRYIRFQDSSLNGSAIQFEEILIELCNSHLSWGCNLSPSRRLDAGLASRIADAGCFLANIGVESGSDNVRRLMNKPMTAAVVESNIKALHAAGISVSVNFMVGYPGESDEDFSETLDFLARVSPYIGAARVSTAALFPGTWLFESRERLGISLGGDLNRDFVFNYWSSLLAGNTPETRKDRLRRLQEQAARVGINDMTPTSRRSDAVAAPIDRTPGGAAFRGRTVT
jgi:hypothetical protein